MKNLMKHILFGVSVGAALFLSTACAKIGGAGWGLGLGPTTVLVPKTESDIVTSADVLKTYLDNGPRGDEDYRDKRFTVMGTVSSIGTVPLLDTPYILFKGQDGSIAKVQCFFPNDRASEVSKINPGDTVKVKGHCDGMLGNIGFDDCEIVP